MKTLIKVVLIIVIVQLCFYCAVCQDPNKKLCLERHIMQNIALKLDSFDLLKELQPYQLNRFKTCENLTRVQTEILQTQTKIIDNKADQIENLKFTADQHKATIKVNTEYINKLVKENKRVRTAQKITLAGGGILTLGLTTALLITLLQ